MIAKLGKRKQDERSYQLLYKQIDDAIFAQIYLSSEEAIVVKEGRIGQRLIYKNKVRPIGPRSKQGLRSARHMYHLASMKWMFWTYRCQPFPFLRKILNSFAWNCPSFWSTLLLGFTEDSMKTMKQRLSPFLLWNTKQLAMHY